MLEQGGFCPPVWPFAFAELRSHFFLAARCTLRLPSSSPRFILQYVLPIYKHITQIVEGMTDSEIKKSVATLASPNYGIFDLFKPWKVRASFVVAS